jgi:hypothetical protein
VFIWIGRLVTMSGPIRRLRPWQIAAIRIAALAIPMAVLLSVAAVEFRRTSGEESEYNPSGMKPSSGSTWAAARAI